MKGHDFERRNVSVYKDVEQVTPQNEKRSPCLKTAREEKNATNTHSCLFLGIETLNFPQNSCSEGTISQLLVNMATCLYKRSG